MHAAGEELSLPEFLNQEKIYSLDDPRVFEWFNDGSCPALCSAGCFVEPDGECPHGHPSVLIALGLI